MSDAMDSDVREVIRRRIALRERDGHERLLLNHEALRALLDAADERDRLAAAVERVRALAEWHETKAMKARRFRPEIDGENRVMDKTAEVHDDAARRVRRALDGTEGPTT